MSDRRSPRAAEPTREQLARFAAVRVHGPAGVLMQREIARIEGAFEMCPRMERLWRRRHAEFQRGMTRAR